MWKKFVFYALFHVAIWSTPENSTLVHTLKAPISTSVIKQNSATSSTTCTTAITTTTTREIRTGDNCSKTEKATNQCSDPKAECRQEGNGHKCLCNDNYYLRNSTSNCTAQIQTGDNCSKTEKAPNQCSDPKAECRQEGNGHKCSCKDNYYLRSSTSNCTARIKIGDTCNKTEKAKNQCSDPKGVCKHGDSQDTCLCKDNFYFSELSAHCIQKIKIGDTCNKMVETAQNQCSDPQGVCKHGDSQDTCSCKENFYFSELSAHCIQKIRTGDTCSNPKEALNQCSDPKAQCVQLSNRYICMCKDNYYLSNLTAVCKKQIRTGYTCNGTEKAQKQCTGPNSQCRQDGNGYKCLCKDSYYYKNSTANCTKQIQTGGICSRTEPAKNQCRDSEADCKNVDSEYKCLCNAKFYLSNDSAECSPRPPKPSIEDIKVSTSDMIFKVKIRPDTSATNGLRIILRKNGKVILQLYRPYEKSIYRIGNLTAGQCYNVEVYSLIDNNTSVDSDDTDICTYPNMPNATCGNSEMTAINISIHKGEGNVQGYRIRVDGSPLPIISKNLSRLNRVIKSEPGTLYKIDVFAVFDRDKYSVPFNLTCATIPSPPKSVNVSEAMTDQLSIEIFHGKGNAAYFDILLNQEYYSSVVAKKDSDITVTDINGLVPGTLYTNFTVIAVSNGINSSQTNVPDSSTVPSVPKYAEVTTETTNSITVLVTPGDGVVQYFDILMNSTYYQMTPVNRNKSTTSIVIGHLHPGTTYGDFEVIAVSHDLNSSSLQIHPHDTRPNIPTLEIINAAVNTTSISGCVHQKEGGGDEFYLYSNETRPLAYVMNGSNFIITSLSPGVLYHIWATVIFQNYTSNKTKTQMVCTVPASPHFEIVKMSTTTNSLVGNINQLIGGHDNFEVYCNGEKMIKIKQNGSLYTVGNLNPGQVYKCSAATLFCNRTSVKSNIVKECTVPASPHFKIVKMSTTTSSLVGNINQSIGGHDSFEIKCNGKKMIKIKQNSSLYTVGNLNPGRIYKCSAATLFCNRTSVESNITKECTVPASPHFKIVNMSTTTNSLVGSINQLIGGHDSFEIYCNGKMMSYLKQNDSLYTIGNLNPGQVYNCSAATFFCNRTSVQSNFVKECTVPSPPHFTIDNQSTTTNTLHGSISQLHGGKDEFTLYCNGTQNLNFRIDGSKYLIKNLNPGTRYSCQASTTFCDHTSEKTTSLQECTVPSSPNFTIDKQSTTKTLQGSIHQRNGGSDWVTIHCNGTNKLNYTIKDARYTIHNLEPGSWYSCQATTQFCNHTSDNTTALQESTVPSTPKSVKVQKSSNETMDLHIYNGKGGVENYIISFQPISKAKCAGKLVQRNGKNSMKIDSLSAGTIYNISIFAVFNKKNSSPYILQHATDPSPPSDIRIKDKKKDSATIEIVKGKGCVKRFVVSVDGIDHNVTASTDKNVTAYLIRGLDSATKYPIKVYAVSNGAYNVEMSSIQISLTTEKDPVPVAIGSVVGVLAALIVTFIVVFAWRRQALCFKKNIPKQVVQGNMNAGFEEEVELADNRRKRPIKLSDFHKHVEMMSRNTHMKFSQEFKELGILSPKHSTDESQIQENRPKNRYTNILPFDHSIVKLIGVEDEIGSDFINANYIPGKKSKREFIATQGPLPSTKEEMWRMIWEQNVSIVVMLTQLIERGRKKCEIYWPENVNEKMFLGDIIVEVETISHLPNYTLRTIALRLGDVERRIKHYNYLAWPDMGTPKTTDIMINFVDTVRQEVKPNMNGPIVVHCSAGVGRTGTFIIMDILLQEIRSKCTEVDIFGMILNMRNYRVNMVQTEDQYIFIHNCVKDLIDVSDNEEEEVGFEDQHELPSTPLIKTVGKTSTSSTLQIINPAGKVRFYRIIINRNTSLPLIPYQSSTQEYIITNLKPGAHYNISVVAVSNGIKSSPSSEINVFTDNLSLKVETVKRTTNSVTLEISSSDRYIKSYEIFLDDNLFKDVLHISQTQNETIKNLVPGTLYNVKVVVTADTENKDVVFDIATLPGQPRSISVLQGMNYSDITIVPPRGAVDFYTFLSSSFCLSSNRIKSSYILETIPNKKTSLRLRTEPGVCCMLYVVVVSNNITSTPLNSTIKRPESVPGKVDYQYMHILENSITIFWSVPQHPNGIVTGYILTFWSNNKNASIKFTCVDCPGANDCSFLSHQQIKSSTFTDSTTFQDINSTIPFKWRQTKFIFTIDKLQQYSNYSFTLWTSTRQGNGPVFSSSFRTVKGHTHESSSSGPIIAGAVVGSIFGTVIILVIGRFVYRWYYRRVKGNTTKPEGRSQQYEDISPETDANVYETLEIAM